MTWIIDPIASPDEIDAILAIEQASFALQRNPNEALLLQSLLLHLPGLPPETS